VNVWKYSLDRVTNLGYRPLHTSALWIGLLSGLVGILPDVDHPLEIFLGVTAPRFFHSLLFLGACTIILGCGACLAGLCIKAILRRPK